jgi:ubiquinone biosynthesis protein
VSNKRAVYVGKVLGNLVIGEALRTTGLARRLGQGETVDRQTARARALRQSLEQLGPLYVKVGQMLSTRPDLMPDYMIDELQHLHEKVSVRPFAEFEPVLESQLGTDWRRFFRSIETEKPLGCASLAQVYAVTLHSGQPAVVKIQRPGVVGDMLDDMALLEKVVKRAVKRVPDFAEVVDLEAVLDVIFSAMRPELDFTIEAANMDEFRPIAARFDTLSVPEVIFVTKQVMVQSLAPGTSIRDVNRDKLSTEKRLAIGKDLLAFNYRSTFVDRIFHADPHPGNVFVTPEGQATLIDFGMVGRLDRGMATSLVLIMLNFSLVDGAGVARSWIELGRPTSWADIPGFAGDMSRFIPTVVGASMENLNFGVSLTNVLKFATRRGIQTTPMVALIGKAFANLDGSVRFLSPELSMVETFRDEFTDLMFEIVEDFLSPEHTIRFAAESALAALSAPDHARTVMRDMADRNLTFRTADSPDKRSRREDREDARAKALLRTLLALGAGAVWLNHRRDKPA